MSSKRYSLTRTVAPTIEPVTLSQAKKQLEIADSDTSHDTHLNLLIQAAREQFEHDTSLLCYTQTWTLTADSFWDEDLHLPHRPIQSLTSITYYDSANSTQTLATSVYALDAAQQKIRLKYDQDWPYTVDRWDAVTITYVGGYSTTATIPAIAKQAVLLLIAHYFEHRGDGLVDAVNTFPQYDNLVRRAIRTSYP